MAKLNATNPLTGTKMNLSIGGIISMLLGGLLLWGVAATTQNLGKAVTERVNNKYVDFEPNRLASGETKVVNQKKYVG